MSGVRGVKVAAISLLCLFFLPQLSMAYSPADSAAVSTDDIVVLLPDDPVPAQATKLSDISINGALPSQYCTYSEIIAAARKMADRMDANIVKITAYHPRDKRHDCDEINAAFYRAHDDAGKYASELAWNNRRQLTWDDFRGIVPAGMDDNTAAATYCGIGFETNVVMGSEKPKVYVYNTFYAKKSWVRPDARTSDILTHEQGHFDLCEVYTRKLREKINNAHINGYNLKPVLSELYNEVNDEYQNQQQQYEDETMHGVDSLQQQKWCRLIKKELNETAAWATGS